MPYPGIPRTISHYRQALVLRREGKTFKQMGTILNVTGQRAGQIWHTAVRMTVAGVEELADFLPLRGPETSVPYPSILMMEEYKKRAKASASR